MVGGVTIPWGTVLKGHNIMKVENHCSRIKDVSLCYITIYSLGRFLPAYNQFLLVHIKWDC